MNVKQMDEDIRCPIEATFVALLHNIDGENAQTFSQLTTAVCHESMGFKTDFIIDTISRCAQAKGYMLPSDWANQMKEITFKFGFPHTLNTYLIKEMITMGYPYNMN